MSDDPQGDGTPPGNGSVDDEDAATDTPTTPEPTPEPDPAPGSGSSGGVFAAGFTTPPEAGASAYSGPDLPDETAPEPEPAPPPPALPVDAAPADTPTAPAVAPPAPGEVPRTADGRGYIYDPRPPVARTPADDPPVGDAMGQFLAYADADGHAWVTPHYGRDEQGEPRVRWAVTVIETKVPYAERPTRGLLDTEQQCLERDYSSLFRALDPDDPNTLLGAADAPDDDPVHGVGVESWWRGFFTEDEVALLRAAPSTRHVTYETRFEPR